MLSRPICKILTLCSSPRKHAGFAKSACFRGDFGMVQILQIIRESMAPELIREIAGKIVIRLTGNK